jgi:predicted O-methyltransferase YrrM
MKKLPEVKNNWGDLYRLFRYGTQSTILEKAIEWKLFDLLISPVDSQHVANKLKSHSKNTELLLNALAGMEIINKKNGLFYNTEKGNEFLVSTSPLYLGDFFHHVNEWTKNLAPNLESLIKNGPPKQMNDNMSSDELWARSARLSAVYQYSGEAQHIVRIVASLPEFPNMKKMLDLGGGSGFFAMTIVDAHPTMKGVIFEQPAVATVARDFIKKYEMQDRVSTIEGDYLTSDLGGPYDLIFASSTLNFYKNNMDDLFKKIYDSLNHGGVFMTHQDGITNERTKPVNHIIEFLSPEMMGMDFAFEQGEIAEAMLRTGFKSVRSFTKHSDMGEMDVDIGRK